MEQLHTGPPYKIYRGTVDEVFSHRGDIPTGSTLELKVFEPEPQRNDETVSLIEAWIASAPTDPEAIKEAEEDLRDFKRNMNRWRKEAGAHVLYPEAE